MMRCPAWVMCGCGYAFARSPKTLHAVDSGIINQCETSKVSCLPGRCIFLYLGIQLGTYAMMLQKSGVAAGQSVENIIYDEIERETRFRCILQNNNNV